MDEWKSQINAGHPAWSGYRGFLDGLRADRFPTVDALNEVMPDHLVNREGVPIRFVPQSALPDVAYEKHIYQTGEVSTRTENWHDLCNALVWFRLPLLKAAMNARHHQCLGAAESGRRGAVRDALTLFDESGVIICSSNAGLLEALAARDWERVFVDCRTSWPQDVSVRVCGHAILEKLLNPYKSLTAHAVFLHSEALLPDEEVDSLLADMLLEGELLRSTADLSPVPLMGIPGWWEAGPQDAAFYADRGVFRPPPSCIQGEPS